MRSIGLDIGEYSVKIVELNLNKKTVHVNQIQEKVLNPNLSGHDKELEVIEFVRSFVESGQYQDCRWVMAVSQDQVTTRFKNFPFSDRLKIAKSLSFEMEEDIPFDTDNCVFDAKVIQTQGNSADVLANAVPKSNVEKIISLAENFGIQISLISIEGLAFANLVESWDQSLPQLPAQPDESVNLSDDLVKPKKFVNVLLNIGYKKTLFSVYENNRLIFVRSLMWGSYHLIQEIIRKNNITHIEAAHLLQQQGLVLLTREGASFEQTQISNTIGKSLRELIRDLQMTIIEMQSEFNAEISHMHYTGGAALLPNLGGFLTQHLEIACNPISLLQPYSNTLAAFTTPERAFATESRFATAFGLSLEGLKKPRNPAINLLKGEFAKQNDRLKLFWETWGTVTQISLAGLFVLFIWTNFRETFSTDLLEKGQEAIKTQAKSVALLPKNKTNEKGIKEYIKENKKKAADLKLVAQFAQMNSALDLLKKVSESSPTKEQIKVDLMSFIVNDDSISISGYMNSPRELDLLKKNLQSLALGKVTDEPGNLPQIANRVSFQMSFKADRGLIK